MTQRVLIDACVLFPPLVRAIVVEIATAGLIQPFWSERIFDEWRIAVVRKHGLEVEAELIASQMALKALFPGASVDANPTLEMQIDLPDAADAHVLAAAIEGQADTLLTFNLRDFPQRRLSPHGIQAAHPDGFLWALLSDAPEAVREAVMRAFNAAQISEDRQRSVLKRARLSRFGKALEAMEAG